MTSVISGAPACWNSELGSALSLTLAFTQNSQQLQPYLPTDLKKIVEKTGDWVEGIDFA